MPHPTTAYVTALIVGAALLLASYPLHAPTAYWLGTTLTSLTFAAPTVAGLTRRPPPPPPARE